MRRTANPSRFLLLLLSGALAGCSGNIVGPAPNDGAGADGGINPNNPPGNNPPGNNPPGNNPPGNNPPGNNPPGEPETEVPGSHVPKPPTAAEPALGAPLVRRLTGPQFRNSLVAIFQDQNVPEGEALVDPAVLGFHVDAKAAVVRDLGAQQLMTYGERVAEWAVANKLNQISPCQSPDADCRRRFIEAFGLKMFREPLPAERVAVYDQLMAGEPTFAGGAALVVSAMIQSPYFLYRREIGAPGAGGEQQLSPYEVASELSYLITESTPDEALLRAAAEGRLNTPADHQRELGRLLDTPAAREMLSSFVRGWLLIGDLETRVKVGENEANFTAQTRAAMLAETDTFFIETFFAGGKIDDLLSARHTYLNQTLAQHYQLQGPGGDQATRVEIPEGRRPSGILGHGSFLTRHALAEQSSPVQRAYTIRKRLLCEHIAPPPPGINTAIEAPAEGGTTREKYAQHSENPVCASCHVLLDPIGFTFEQFDHFGRFRDQQNGQPIDVSGAMSENRQMRPEDRAAVPGGMQTLAGHQALIDYLVQGDRVEECFGRFFTYYAYGVQGVATRAVGQAAQAGDAQLKNYLSALVSVPHFTRRRAE